MMDPAPELKIRQRIDDVLLTGNFRSAEVERADWAPRLKARRARSAAKSASEVIS